MKKIIGWIIFRVFIFVWAHVVAWNSRQHCRLLIALAGELTVIAGVSRTDSCFKISSLTLSSAVAEHCFFHFSLLWHLTEGREVTLQLMVLWGLSGSWEADGPIALFLGGTSFQNCRRKKSRAYPRGSGRSALLFAPQMGIPPFGGRDEQEENNFWNLLPRCKMNGKNMECKINFLVTAVGKEYTCWWMLLFWKCSVPCQPRVFSSQKLKRITVNDVLRIFRSYALPYVCFSSLFMRG